MKKFILLFLVGLILFFPDEIFSSLAGIFIILLVLVLIVEVLLDVYIVVALFIQSRKDKKKNRS